MSDCIDNDLEFHGTKKGGRRKTVSKRRAYVNTPSVIIRKIQAILPLIRSGVRNEEAIEALQNLIKSLR